MNCDGYFLVVAKYFLNNIWYIDFITHATKSVKIGKDFISIIDFEYAHYHILCFLAS